MKLSHNLQPPDIPVLDDSTDRPLWSVMIPTHNCADSLERTLRSVLDQDPGRAIMQIAVVDDCSNRDNPEAVVRKIAGDRVEFTRQVRNRGHASNFNSCISKARGYLVHILHGDDWVKKSFYAKLETGFAAESVGAAFCRSVYIDHEGAEVGLTDLELDKSGVIDDWFIRILSGQRVCTPSMVVRRDVYEKLGGFDTNFKTAGEDWEMWVRIAAHYPVWYEPTVLACYRLSRPGSLTGAAARTTRVARDMRLACNTVQTRLQPILKQRKLESHLTAARRFYAGWSLNYAQYAIRSEGILRTLPHLKEAFLFYPTRWMAKRIFRLVLGQPLALPRSPRLPAPWVVLRNLASLLWSSEAVSHRSGSVIVVAKNRLLPPHL